MGKPVTDRILGPLTRRTALRLGLSSGVAFGLAACAPATSSVVSPAAASASAAVAIPTDPPELFDLVKKAQVEGTLTWYSSAVPNAIAILGGGFTGKYGIPVNIVRLVSAPQATRFTAEAEGGKMVADVIQMSDLAFLDTATKKGWLAKPTPAQIPALKAWPSKFSLYGSSYMQAMGLYDIAYNTNLVKGNDIPDKWEKVLDPKWKNLIMMSDPRNNLPNQSWLYLMRKTFGDSFLKGLGQQNLKLTTSTAIGINSVASGEVAMIVPTNYWSNVPLISAGAPIAEAYPTPTTAAEQWMALVQGAPHPSAAALFFHYALSLEGQMVECKNLCTSALNAPGTIPLPDGYVSPPVAEATAQKAELLGLIGLQ